ncbi:catabolite control protein A [Gordoniibacillus kamchatkensis]|uniref:Catabolite control protein A n=1 Tax=Gordoniibacillus kamchatkensis TaxID=1590651 RepID=A0ABR5AI25_9BACL|nr:LacI family DNA-binding transcriptional regulator [Paenibacillus sp. VKM B-2647]KIL40676.1 catabolite control protein A [Paenibacillus sp. VKM B-2647]
MKSTIRDVAVMAGVSISTVSRVMNAPNSVVKHKREKVLEAIKALQYKPNGLARGLIYKKTNTLGVIIPDIQNPYYAGVIRGMEDASKALGYSIMICNTDRDEKRLFSYMQNLNEKRVDGILYTSDVVYPDFYEEIEAYRIPLVLVATHSLEYELPSVKINDEAAAYDAVKYLISLGHTSIGMISFELTDEIAGLPRYEGFQRALREYELEACVQQVAFAKHWHDDAYYAAERLLQQYPDITAIFTTSDEFAMGVLSYMHEKGIRVPEQMSVIGFDNIRMAQFTIPKLSTIAQPVYNMGYRAVEKLNALIKGEPDSTLREYLPHELIVRSSTGPQAARS